MTAPTLSLSSIKNRKARRSAVVIGGCKRPTKSLVFEICPNVSGNGFALLVFGGGPVPAGISGAWGSIMPASAVES